VSPPSERSLTNPSADQRLLYTVDRRKKFHKQNITIVAAVLAREAYVQVAYNYL